jgi:hypothetical protein
MLALYFVVFTGARSCRTDLLVGMNRCRGDGFTNVRSGTSFVYKNTHAPPAESYAFN